MKKLAKVTLLFLVLFSQFLSAQTQNQPAQGSVSASYRLRPLDVIDMKVFQELDLTVQVRIAQDGTVVLPLLGTVMLKDLTLMEATNKITELYGEDFLVNPQITLYIFEYSVQSVYVIGQVMRQGIVPFPKESSSMTLSRAIGDAGGPTRLADLRNINIRRKLSDGQIKVFVQDLKEIMRNPATLDFPLEDGDIIEVKESTF